MIGFSIRRGAQNPCLLATEWREASSNTVPHLGPLTGLRTSATHANPVVESKSVSRSEVLRRVPSRLRNPFSSHATDDRSISQEKYRQNETLLAGADSVTGLSESGESTPASQNHSSSTANRRHPQDDLTTSHGGPPDSENPMTLSHLRAGRSRLPRGVFHMMGRFCDDLSHLPSDSLAQ